MQISHVLFHPTYYSRIRVCQEVARFPDLEHTFLRPQSWGSVFTPGSLSPVTSSPGNWKENLHPRHGSGHSQHCGIQSHLGFSAGEVAQRHRKTWNRERLEVVCLVPDETRSTSQSRSTETRSSTSFWNFSQSDSLATGNFFQFQFLTLV